MRIGIALLAFSLAACSGSSATAVPSPSPTAVPFQITSPTTGRTVTSSPVTVSGTAPAGATITEEVLFAEVRATADAAGKWSMIVKLKDGVNDLTFQLNNDQNARIYLQLTLVAASATPAITPPATSAATPPPEATPSTPS